MHFVFFISGLDEYLPYSSGEGITLFIHLRQKSEYVVPADKFSSLPHFNTRRWHKIIKHFYRSSGRRMLIWRPLPAMSYTSGSLSQTGFRVQLIVEPGSRCKLHFYGGTSKTEMDFRTKRVASNWLDHMRTHITSQLRR
jgi:hypothetical protein